MKKNIFKILDRNYILGIFKKRRRVYFPKYKEISDIEIERFSPPWYKKTCLARYKVLFSDSDFEIIRGSAAVNISKRENFKIMKCLYENGFNKGRFQIPRPLDYISETDLLLYEDVSGAPLSSILEREKPALKIFKEIAEFLFKLHSFKKIERRNKIKKLKDYKKAFKRIVSMFPELAPEIIPLKKIAFFKNLLKGSSFIHGDFYPGNIIVDDDRIFFIDFDRAGRGSILEDLSSLYFSLEYPKYVWPSLNLSAEEIKRFQNAFLIGYANAGNINYSSLKEEVEKFFIKTFLEPLYYITGFAWNGRKEIDNKGKRTYFLKIKELLLRLKKHL